MNCTHYKHSPQVCTSVPDPDPRVFWPPWSGSTSQRYGSDSGSGSFYHHAKIIRKTLNPTYSFVTLFDFFSLKIKIMYINVPSKSNNNKQKKLCSKICFLLASWRSMTKIAGSGSRIRISLIFLRFHPTSALLDSIPFLNWCVQENTVPSDFHAECRLPRLVFIPELMCAGKLCSIWFPLWMPPSRTTTSPTPKLTSSLRSRAFR